MQKSSNIESITFSVSLFDDNALLFFVYGLTCNSCGYVAELFILAVVGCIMQA